MKKKLIAMTVILSLAALALMACGEKKTDPQPVTTQAVVPGSGTEEPSQLPGGWQVNDDETIGWATDEAKAAFEKAKEGLVGADYSIVSLLGTQVVAGTNYLFLCKVKPVVPDATPALCFVTVYEDLEGNSQITHTEDLDLGLYCGALNPSSPEDFAQLAGGWTIPESFMAVNLPLPVATVYDKVMGDEAGYYPMAYLGSQIEAGTDYVVLCFGENAPCLVYMYEPLEGDPELINIYEISMAEFSGE